jgi:hypothetical protein
MRMRKGLCILALLVALAACKKADPVIGKWQEVSYPAWTEYFADGSVIRNDGMASTSGTWKRLEDGRLKVDATVLGSSVAEVYQVAIAGDNASFTDSAGKVRTYQRSSGTVQGAVTPSANAPQAAGVRNDPGSPAAPAGAGGNQDRDREAQKKTIADMRNLGTAMFSWLTDQVGAGAAGQSQTEPAGKAADLAQYSPISHAELEKILVPQYLQTVPERDGWGHPYELYLNVKNVLAPQVMGIRSPGRDGRFSANRYSVGSFPPDQFDEDIVWVDGFFARWPQKGPS